MESQARERYLRAIEATRRAGAVALAYFDAGVEVEWKADESPVTLADRSAEELLRSVLLTAFPDDGFLGEEFGDKPGTSGFRWVVDPIDGTRSFVRGVPLWGTLVGLEYRGDPVAGVVYEPALGNLYRALRGDGAYRNERRIRVSDVDKLDQATVFFTSPYYFVRAGREDVLGALARRTQQQRGFGDYFGFMLVARGSGEAMIDHGVHAWDVAAVVPIIEEAGGTFTSWDGRRTTDEPAVLASNGKLHAAFAEVLKG